MPSPPPPDFVFVQSPGRSGTQYLSRVFSTCTSTTSLHEPTPTLASYSHSLAPSSSDLQHKLDALLASKAKSKSLYCETSHTLLHASIPYSFEAILKPLLRLHGFKVAVVRVRRPIAEVVKSRRELGHGTTYKKDGEVRYRGLSWIYLPSSPLATLAPLKPDLEHTPVEILCAYCLNVAAAADALATRADSEPGLTVMELCVSELSDLGAMRRMLHGLGMEYDDCFLREVVNNGKCNIRADEKKRKGEENLPLSVYEEELEKYIQQLVLQT